jgi:hypothetical protein
MTRLCEGRIESMHSNPSCLPLAKKVIETSGTISHLFVQAVIECGFRLHITDELL